MGSELEIRIERPGEERAIEEIVRNAFQDDRTPALVAALRSSSAWRDLSFVATLDDKPIAHVAFTRGWLDAPTRLEEVLILSPLSVLPRHQRQGVGSLLVTNSIALLKSRSEPLIFLEGNPAFYSRVGFRPGTERGFLRPSQRIPEAAFQYRTLPGFDLAMSGQLVYPEVFWATDCVGLRP